ncbi:MAG: hypothetical protein OEZ68_04965 [Gammaproteobacteria bacterium]|nr:hypothetical protein [Gammaproteobacteria bacterium]MDH5800139.1 hypothetical protein [Gammaproteobacteria bacterium]
MKSVILSFIVLCVTSINAFAIDVTVPGVNPVAPVRSAYFTVRPDLRRCVSPICGGWYVSAVNLRAFQCPDGSVRTECYVSTDTINIPNLSPDQILELRQAMQESRALVAAVVSKAKAYGLLEINSAWIAATAQKPVGEFVSVRDNGIRCITSPCPSYDATVLNKNVSKNLAGFDLSAVNAGEEQLKQAYAAISSDDGLPMAGTYTQVVGPAGTAAAINANQFYLKLENTQPRFCAPTGCSGQICSDTDVISTCEWRPEYACYQNAQCSTQANGECGWVMDEELRRCLANAGGTSLLRNAPTQ